MRSRSGMVLAAFGALTLGFLLGGRLFKQPPEADADVAVEAQADHQKLAPTGAAPAPIRIPGGTSSALPPALSEPESVPEGTVVVCPEFRVSGLTDEMLARTKLQTRSAWESFIKDQGTGFNSMRQAVLPLITSRSRAVQDCYARTKTTPVMVHLTLHLWASADRAAIKSVDVGTFSGPDEARSDAQDCLQRELLTHVARMSIDRKPDQAAFAPFDDVYPNPVQLMMGKGLEEFLFSDQR
jgi:hypothetical protein